METSFIVGWGRRHGYSQPTRPASPTAGRRTVGGTGRRGATLVFMAEIDPRLGQVIGSHLHRHPISGKNPNAVLLHAPRGISQYFMSTFEGDTETGIGQHFADNTLKFNQVFFSQVFFSNRPKAYKGLSPRNRGGSQAALDNRAPYMIRAPDFGKHKTRPWPESSEVRGICPPLPRPSNGPRLPRPTRRYGGRSRGGSSPRPAWPAGRRWWCSG